MNGAFKNLNDALVAAKKDRDILSKQIIWESGVGKSQFYRIISGKETPSQETKLRISKSLNIDSDEFERLHRKASAELEIQPVEFISKPDTQIAKPKFASLGLLTVIAISVFSLAAMSLSSTTTQTEPRDISVQNDSTQFIKDVTIPDGTSIPINTTYVKTWRVKNTGDVVWKDRYLKRVTPHSKLLCSSPTMIPIPETAPGETVDISVTFVTPHIPGSCRTDWKSADRKGNFHFPEKHGLYSIVTVTEK